MVLLEPPREFLEKAPSVVFQAGIRLNCARVVQAQAVGLIILEVHARILDEELPHRSL